MNGTFQERQSHIFCNFLGYNKIHMQGEKWVSHKICFVDVVSIFIIMAELRIRGGIADNQR